MFGCFRKGEANDPETYAAAVAAVLSRYSPAVVKIVTDPRTGLPGKSKFLPTVSEVREACEEEAQQHARAVERQAQIDRQIAERKAYEESLEAPRPSLHDMKARHGPSWGLSVPEGETDAARDKRREILVKANRTQFERECREAGIDPARGVSPSLVALIREQDQRRAG